MFNPPTTDIRRLSPPEKAILALSALGAAFMAYLLALHFRPDASSLCDFGAAFSCEIVNRSIYSEVAGVPVSALGLAYFLTAIAAIALRARLAHEFIALFTVGALVFSAYLSFVEARLLYTFCLFCELSKLLMIAIVIHCERHLRALGTRMPVWAYAAALAGGAVFTIAVGTLQQ